MSVVTISSTGQGADAAALLKQFRITKADLELVRKIGKKVEPDLSTVIEDFYKWLRAQPYFDTFFTSEKRVDEVKAAQMKIWQQFFQAKIDDEYIESRRAIGTVHARIELPLETYMAGMNIFYQAIMDALSSGGKPSAQQQQTIIAVSKAIHLDTMVTADTYAQLTNEKMLEQSKSLIEMSTPVTAIWDGILMLPLVGVIDSGRALDITTRVLEEIARSQATCFILDISGVAVIDTAVANYLIKITKATRLMGCEAMISGLSPSIAQTIANLGIDVGDVQTTGNLRDALKLAFIRSGLTVSKS